MKKPALIAAVFGVVGALFAALYLDSLETTYKKSTEKVKVLVAKSYIDQGAMLNGDVVEEKHVPKEYIQPKAISLVKELYGSEGKRIYMAIVPIETGEQITTTKLSLIGLDTGISAVIPSGRRAITLLMDASTITGIVKPGNRIDVIGVYQYEDSKGQPQDAAYTLLQNVLVLATGNTVLGAVKPAGEPSEKSGMKAMVQESQYTGSIPVSIAVSPREAEIMALAAERAAIRLSLRPLGEDSFVESSGVNIKEIAKEIVKIGRNKDSTPQVSIRSEMGAQINQKEVIELLKKYKKN